MIILDAKRFDFHAAMNFDGHVCSFFAEHVGCGLVDEAYLFGMAKVFNQPENFAGFDYSSAVPSRNNGLDIKQEHPRRCQTTLNHCCRRSSLSLVEIMRLLKYLFLLVLNKITIHEAVHLKIYVPDVVNHHFHTKTVLLHVHKPAPKKPKHHNKHEYHANWSSWKTYGHDHDFKEFSEEQEEPKQEITTKKPINHKDKQQKYLPNYGHHKDSYFPHSYMDDNDLEEKDRQRGKKPSYAVYEDVNDIPPNTESFAYNYEEGYRKGLQEEAGHIRTDQMTKFHEDQQEELDDNENEGSRDEYEGKTDAGRYFVDDIEYENTRDKREPGKNRRFRRIIKI